MGRRPMTVTFTKVGRTCAWEALRPPRTRVRGPSMAAGGDVPHDLATFVVERALGLEHGFWGCVAAGATFRGLDRARTPRGRAVIAAHEEELDAAEAAVNERHFGWRAGRSTDVDAELDAALVAWRALAEGEGLTLEWSPAEPSGRGRRR